MNRKTNHSSFMKQYFQWEYILIPAIAVLFLACGGDKGTTKALPDAPVYTLVFLDKTQSVNINRKYVSEKYQRVLKDLVETNMKNKGDKLEVILFMKIHQKYVRFL